MTKHWSTSNSAGICTFPLCKQYRIVESPEHLLLCCSAYDNVRESLLQLCQSMSNPVSALAANEILSSFSTRDIMQLILDPSSIPSVIRYSQLYGEQIFHDLFYMGRTWCFSIHRERMKRLNRWNFR